MRTIFYTTIAVILAIFNVVANNNASIIGIGAISHIEKVNSPPLIRDTIRFEDGSKFTTSRSFLSFFEGYRDLLQNNENIMLWFMGDGYTNNWIERGKKIYLERGLFSIADGTHPTQQEWQEIIETLTGEKFNDEGLLPANWLTGSFNLSGTIRLPEVCPLRRNAPYGYWRDFEKEYVFHFCKGRVKKIEITETGIRNKDVYRGLLEEAGINCFLGIF